MSHRHGSEPVLFDGGERRCVQLLIELRDLVAGLAPGAVVHLIATDPAAPLDLPAWCHLTGHTYLGPLPTASRPTYAIQVRAIARAHAFQRALASHRRLITGPTPDLGATSVPHFQVRRSCSSACCAGLAVSCSARSSACLASARRPRSRSSSARVACKSG